MEAELAAPNASPVFLGKRELGMLAVLARLAGAPSKWGYTTQVSLAWSWPQAIFLWRRWWMTTRLLTSPSSSVPRTTKILLLVVVLLWLVWWIKVSAMVGWLEKLTDFLSYHFSFSFCSSFPLFLFSLSFLLFLFWHEPFRGWLGRVDGVFFFNKVFFYSTRLFF